MFVSNDKLYIAGDRRISLFDIKNPGKPDLSAEFDTVDGVSGIFVGEDGNIYMAAGSNGLRVLIMDNMIVNPPWSPFTKGGSKVPPFRKGG